jgi:hypothetical protein
MLIINIGTALALALGRAVYAKRGYKLQAWSEVVEAFRPCQASARRRIIHNYSWGLCIGLRVSDAEPRPRRFSAARCGTCTLQPMPLDFSIPF